MKLRKYQQEIIDYIEASVAFGSTKIIVEAPTGSGKSLLISELCKSYPDDKIVILVNVSKLIGQISEHLSVVGVEHSILKSGMEDDFDETKRVQLVMEQTYHARKKKVKLSADIIIRDEHHIGYAGDRFTQLHKELAPRVTIGFSATPYDSFGVAIPGYEIASFVSIKSLTKQGYLMPAHTFIPRFGQNIDLASIKTSADYSESELDNLLNNPEYNQGVVSLYKEYQGGEKAIVFVSGIEHAEELAKEFKKNGVACEALHSKLTAKEQQSYMDRFKNVTFDSIDVLVSVSMLTTGFDMPDCNAVFNCRPTKVRSLYVQMIGRVLRTNGDYEEEASIYDCCRATTDHGLYDSEFVIEKDRHAAKKTAKAQRLDIIDYMLNVCVFDVVPVNDKYIEMAYEEQRTDDSVEAMVYNFETATTAEDLLRYACSLYDRFYGVRTTVRTIDWILSELRPGVKEFGIKPFRTRLRNIIKGVKQKDGTTKVGKIASVYYFRKWLKEQQWSNY